MMDWGGFIMNLVELDAPNQLVRLREKGNIIVRRLAHPITDCNLKDPSMLLFLADICFQSTQLACLRWYRHFQPKSQLPCFCCTQPTNHPAQ
jgi:hypothetical protein